MTQNKILPYDQRLVPIARELRQNMTPGEVILWQKIRKKALGYQFHRQVPINKFIVDFYCHELFLAIEVDGSSHDHPDVSVSDLERQKKLEKLGVNFLRFKEASVKNKTNSVLTTISNWIANYTD